MRKYNILVFPCGSEVGLEIYRSIKYSSHVNVFGANSVDDHGKFIYENYIGGLPHIDSERIIPTLKQVIEKYKIDAIYPVMDKVIWKLQSCQSDLGCKVISSNEFTTELCMSKSKAYKFLADKVKVPKVFSSLEEVDSFPIFIKPDIGYGTRGTFKANSLGEGRQFLFRNNQTSYVITEFLPSEEFTVDCFTDRKGNLLFVGPRLRKRILNGISVNTIPIDDSEKNFYKIAATINSCISFRGAWFFQVKRDNNGNLTLLEIASRLGGSSALYRAKGINFALLSIFDIFDYDVQILINEYDIEMDRALSNRYKINLVYSTVYVDFDDCLIIRDKVNSELIAFLYHALNNNKKIVLITKYVGDLEMALKKYRLTSIFDKIIHLNKQDSKSDFIENEDSIFIDDSFAERMAIFNKIGIPVFSPDMIECLL
jgi:hypothetical protein